MAEPDPAAPGTNKYDIQYALYTRGSGEEPRGESMVSPSIILRCGVSANVAGSVPACRQHLTSAVDYRGRASS